MDTTVPSLLLDFWGEEDDWLAVLLLSVAFC